MKLRILFLPLALLLVTVAAFAQSERVDTTTVLRIKTEGLTNSRVMDYASWLTDVHSPRLSWSPEYRSAAEWVRRVFAELGLVNIRYENHGPVGRGWTLKQFNVRMTAPQTLPLIAYPKAWSPGISKEAEVVLLDAKSLDELKGFEGALKGKYVLLNDIVPVTAHLQPEGERLSDSALLAMANADMPMRGRRGGRPFLRTPRLDAAGIDSMFHAMRQFMPAADSATIMRMIISRFIDPRKLEFAQAQGALAVITAGRGDGGTFFVQGATVPQPADLPFNERVSAYDPKAPKVVPQIVFAAEHYNRLVRMIRKGERVKLDIELDVEWTKADSSFNILAEIPGTDLKDEVVIIGGHFDTWHAGTGATDNSSGSAVCLEAVRILQTVMKEAGMQPRRTIRVGLWGAEEQGLIGSRAYVATHYANDARANENVTAYFNHDNGTGRIRGVYLQGNESVRPIFRSWLSVYNDPTAQTLTLENTGGTDHQSFDAAGIPGFQFIQDPIEYDTRTHHSNMDVYERLLEEDMTQAATIMAVFAYNAAMRDQKLPRKPAAGGR